MELKTFSGRHSPTRGGGRRFGVSEGVMIDQSASRPKAKDASLDEARLRQQAIGAKLRQMFNEVVNEPVPDEFLDILRKADSRNTDGA